MAQSDQFQGQDKREHGPAAAVQAALKGAHYPTQKGDLINLAQHNGARRALWVAFASWPPTPSAVRKT